MNGVDCLSRRQAGILLTIVRRPVLATARPLAPDLGLGLLCGLMVGGDCLPVPSLGHFSEFVSLLRKVSLKAEKLSLCLINLQR